MLLFALSANAQNELKVYQNYDFVSGDKILFEDNFNDDQDGEFPAHWALEGGQGVINKMGDERVFAIIKYYSLYSPNIKYANAKNKSYLPDDYTIEFDTWLDAAYDSNEGVFIEFRANGEKQANIRTSNSAILCEFGDKKLSGDLPSALAGDQYFNKWHHLAIAVKGTQIKVYLDQYRILVVPNSGFKAASLAFGGNASDGMPMLFKNVKVAAGAGMNLLGKKFTDAKIITHGIHFDVNKATIKPESMGTLNMIAQLMKEDATLKFEIGGHTDSDGDDAENIKLSQQRADAVKTQLVCMGITASRLNTKGYGEQKPINDNTSIEGKANNRRVEFVKI